MAAVGQEQRFLHGSSKTEQMSFWHWKSLKIKLNCVHVSLFLMQLLKWSYTIPFKIRHLFDLKSQYYHIKYKLSRVSCFQFLIPITCTFPILKFSPKFLYSYKKRKAASDHTLRHRPSGTTFDKTSDRPPCDWQIETKTKPLLGPYDQVQVNPNDKNQSPPAWLTCTRFLASHSFILAPFFLPSR